MPIPADIPDEIAAIFDPFGNAVHTGLDLSELITHRIGIDEFEDGFAAMNEGEAGKVVMDWV